MITEYRRREAAFTKAEASYPGFINATVEGEQVTVTVRGDARDGAIGPLVSLPLTMSQWRVFLTEIDMRL